jgi:ketosteroid isomerase-like protein
MSPNEVPPIDQAKDVIAEHERSSRLGDLNGVMTNMADDVVVLVYGVPLVEGKAAVREFYAGYFKAGSLEFGHEYEGAEVVADTVVLHGVARGRFTPHGGQPSTFANNFILVLKKQPDSKYRFWRIAAASSSAP